MPGASERGNDPDFGPDTETLSSHNLKHTNKHTKPNSVTQQVSNYSKLFPTQKLYTNKVKPKW